MSENTAEEGWGRASSGHNILSLVALVFPEKSGEQSPLPPQYVEMGVLGGHFLGIKMQH